MPEITVEVSIVESRLTNVENVEVELIGNVVNCLVAGTAVPAIVPLLYVMLYETADHFAYKVISAVVVYAPLITVPLRVSDQPSNVKPVLLPAEGRARLAPPVVYDIFTGDAEPPFELNETE